MAQCYAREHENLAVNAQIMPKKTRTSLEMMTPLPDPLPDPLSVWGSTSSTNPVEGRDCDLVRNGIDKLQLGNDLHAVRWLCETK